MIEAAACDISDTVLHRQCSQSSVIPRSLECQIVLSCFLQQMPCTKPDQFSLRSTKLESSRRTPVDNIRYAVLDHTSGLQWGDETTWPSLCRWEHGRKWTI